MPTNILNLPVSTITKFHEDEHDYHSKAETKQQIVSCPNCHYIELEGFGRREPVSHSSMGRHMIGFKSLVSTNNYYNQTDIESEESINYGVDIAMLTRMIFNKLDEPANFAWIDDFNTPAKIVINTF